MIKFVSIGKFPIKETFKDLASWNKWLVNGWIERHLPCALIISIGIVYATLKWNIIEAIVFGSIVGWFISYGVEFYQKWQITKKNPNHKWTEKELLESSKDWIATTIFFIIFIVVGNLIFNQNMQ